MIQVQTQRLGTEVELNGFFYLPIGTMEYNLG